MKNFSNQSLAVVTLLCFASSILMTTTVQSGFPRWRRNCSTYWINGINDSSWEPDGCDYTPNNELPPIVRSGCSPVFNLSVEDKQLIDHSQRLWVASRNAFINDTVCFNPRNNAHLLVPALNNFDYGTRVAISVTFELGENFNSNQTALLGNCAPDAYHNASVYLGVERDVNGSLFVTGSIITHRSLEPYVLRLPISTGKTSATLVYNGYVIYLAVGDNVIGVSARGHILRLQSDLLIAHPVKQDDGYFDVCIDQVLVTECL